MKIGFWYFLGLLDRTILSGRLRRIYRLRITPPKLRNLRETLGEYSSMVITYPTSSASPLNGVFQTRGSDKGSFDPKVSDHLYADFYDMIFQHIKTDSINIFECGIGSRNEKIQGFMGLNAKPGASLYAWRDWFPNATIFGADIDEDILFSDNRIQTGFIDQLDPESVLSFWQNLNLKHGTKFEIMIDDGLHTLDAAWTLFDGSIEFLSNSGFYIVEDLDTKDRVEFCKKLDSAQYKSVFVDFHSSERGEINGTLLVVSKVQSV